MNVHYHATNVPLLAHLLRDSADLLAHRLAQNHILILQQEIVPLIDANSVISTTSNDVQATSAFVANLPFLSKQEKQQVVRALVAFPTVAKVIEQVKQDGNVVLEMMGAGPYFLWRKFHSIEKRNEDEKKVLELILEESNCDTTTSTTPMIESNTSIVPQESVENEYVTCECLTFCK